MNNIKEEYELWLGPKAFKVNENIFPYNKLLSSIRNVIYYSKEERYSPEKSNVISILGNRGSGKTSLLLSIKKYIETTDDELLKKIHILENPIDPSIFLDSNNIIKLIISLLFNSFINNNEIQKDNRYREIIQDFVEINKTVNRLTKDLNDIDSLDDLIATQNIYNLKNNIKQLINKYLNEIHKETKYLMIMIDDFDLNIQSCYEMLEQIRKYLSIPNVIILVAGNYRDFIDVIQNEYSNQLKFLYYKDENSFFPMKMLGKASNYIIKILPEPYQIDLSTIKYSISLQYIIEIFKYLKIINFYLPIDTESYNNFLSTPELLELINISCGNSLRSIIHLLLQYREMEINDKNIYENETKIKIKDIIINHISKSCNDTFTYGLIELDNINSNDLILHFDDKSIANYSWTLCDIIYFLSNLNDNNKYEYLKKLSITSNALFYNIDKYESNLFNYRSENNLIFPWDIIPLDGDNFSKNIFGCIFMITIINNFKERSIKLNKYKDLLLKIIKIYVPEKHQIWKDILDNIKENKEIDLFLRGNTIKIKELSAEQEKELYNNFTNLIKSKRSIRPILAEIKRKYNFKNIEDIEFIITKEKYEKDYNKIKNITRKDFDNDKEYDLIRNKVINAIYIWLKNNA